MHPYACSRCVRFSQRTFIMGGMGTPAAPALRRENEDTGEGACGLSVFRLVLKGAGPSRDMRGSFSAGDMVRVWERPGFAREM